MLARAVVVESLDLDGGLRSFYYDSDRRDRPLLLAFADEYDEPRIGPFHFLERADERLLERGMTCSRRRLGAGRFRVEEGEYHVSINWRGIPTARNYRSYYALSLPRLTCVTRFTFSDPHSGREYRSELYEDASRSQPVLYLICSSRRGLFDFDLECSFTVAPSQWTGSRGGGPDLLPHDLSLDQKRRVEAFFDGGGEGRKPDALLQHSEALRVAGILGESDTAEPDRRRLLLRGVPSRIVSLLPRLSIPREQVMSDVITLNTQRHGHGQHPLHVYLQNSIFLMQDPETQAQVERLLAEAVRTEV